MGAVADGQTRTCPFCAEVILAAAVKCKHCSSDLSTTPTQHRTAQRAWKLAGALICSTLTMMVNGLVAASAYAQLSKVTQQESYDRLLEHSLAHAAVALACLFAIVGFRKLQGWAVWLAEGAAAITAVKIGYLGWDEWPAFAAFSGALGIALFVFAQLSRSVMRQVGEERRAEAMAAAAASIEPPAA